MFKPIYIVGFSGNRPSSTYGRDVDSIDAMRSSLDQAFDQIEGVLRSGKHQVELCCSVAAGADTLACEVALERSIPVHLVLPKPIDAFKSDFEGEEADAWLRAEAIIRHAENRENGSTLRIAAVSGSGSACYEVANSMILEAADMMMFLWNGIDTQKEGGAGELMRQTQALELPYVVLNTIDEKGSGGSEIEIVGSFPEADGADPMIEFLRSEAAAAEAGEFKETWTALEDAADRSGKWYRRSITFSILFHGGGALIGGIAVTYAVFLKQLHPGALAILSGLELVLVATAFVLMLWHSKRHTQKVWLRCRFASELMRSYNACAGILDPIFPNVRCHVPEWRRFALSALLHADRHLVEDRSLGALRGNYIKKRIKDQVKYFRGECDKAIPLSDLCHRVGNSVAWLALISVTIAFCFKLYGWKFYSSGAAYTASSDLGQIIKYGVIYFLPIALPLIAGISHSLSSSLDVDRRKKRYSEMVKVFEKQEKYLEEVNDLQVLQQSVKRIEEILFDEQIEWNASTEIGQAH